MINFTGADSRGMQRRLLFDKARHGRRQSPVLSKERSLNTVGRKLLLSIALPSLIAALLGLWALWQRTDSAVRNATRDEAVTLAEVIAGSFRVTGEIPAGTQPRVAHRAVTGLIRSELATRRQVTALRVIDSAGVVRWSRQVEEEDKPFDGAARVLAVGQGQVKFETRGEGGEVLVPLGGVACAGCHTGDSTMRAGVLQLQIEEQALGQQVEGEFKKALRIVLLFAVALVLATALSLRWVLTRPLGALAEAMKRAEAGDFLTRAEASSSDELGQLAQAFNRMLARITSLKAEEIDNRRDLDEARVELQLKEELETRLSELSILYDVARTVTSTLEPTEVLNRITELVPRRLKVPKFSVMLVNALGDLEVKQALPTGSEGMTFAMGEGICGVAAATRKAQYVGDLEQGALFKVRGGTGKGRGSLLAVPMVHGGELLGVLNFERPEMASFSAEEIEFFTGVADQTALALQNARLHAQTVELSITDPLTGVANRRYLFQHLEAEINRANRFGTQLSMLMIDIDHFKKLNDTSGHSAGDAVLREVCQLMKGMVRRVDTLARYGGEEFVVVLPQVTHAEAIEVAEKLRRAVETAPIPYREGQPDGKVTVSIGVANLPIDATDLKPLVDCADSALYASKRGGRNRVTGYAAGMEVHPGRERGPHAAQRRATSEIPAVKG